MLVFALIIIGVVLSLAVFYLKHKRTFDLIERFPGPPAIPLLGNVFNFAATSSKGSQKMLIENHKKYGETFRYKILHVSGIMTTDPRIYELILGNPTKYLKKHTSYRFLVPWLGDGLLINSGKVWRKHRKAITPAFHFKILEQFVEVFDRLSNILLEKLKNECEKDVVDILPFVTLMTLDVICETAMGTKINAQNNSKSSYVKAVDDISSAISLRFTNPWKHGELLFSIFDRKSKKRIDQSIKVLHNFTNDVITQRREYLLNCNNNSNEVTKSNENIGMSRKMALLDVLLQTTVDGKPLTNEEIRDEVDNFMFAGHDTTTGSITHTLYLLSRHPEIQERLFHEIKQVVGTSNHQPITYRQLQELKYMDLVLKESFRMLPLVPVIGRHIEEDILLDDGRIIPANCDISFNLSLTFMNPKYFKNPEIFDPERFSVENQAAANNNPYAYIPFSAGSRNCIGQKYGLLETKMAIVKVLSRFKLLPRGEEPNFDYEIVTRSKNGIQMGLTPRNS